MPNRLSRIAPTALTLLLLAITACREQPAARETESKPELLQRITRPVEGGRVHLVRIVQRGDDYSFDPDEVRAESGDVVRFVLSGSQPESVVFDTAGASPEAASFIVTRSLGLGVLLTDQGQSYDVSLEGAPPGSYPFASLPHAIQGMRGMVLVR